jgi:hypothetical protein
VAANLNSDPQSYREAPNRSLCRQWMDAMREEYASLLENHTFIPVQHAAANDKARLVPKDYKRTQGADYDETRTSQ